MSGKKDKPKYQKDEENSFFSRPSKNTKSEVNCPNCEDSVTFSSSLPDEKNCPSCGTTVVNQE